MSCSGSVTFPDSETAKLLARNNKVIWGEVCAIQQAILAAVDPSCELEGNAIDGFTCVKKGASYCAIIGGKTPMSWAAGVSEVIVTAPGVGYYPVIATATFTGPASSPGAGATADVVVSDSGLITDFTITAGGTGYDPILAVATVGAPGGGAILDLVIDLETGAIADVIITSAGINYDLTSPITVTHPNGTGAILTILSVGIGGEIASVGITAPGENYQTIYAQVEVNHPIGVGFEGIVQVTAGVVTGVSIQNPGMLYIPMLPQVVIEDAVDSNGAGARTLAVVDELGTGELLSVDVLEPGANYSAGTIGTVIPIEYPTGVFNGSGATVDVTVDVNPFNTVPYDYYLALIGQSDDCGLKDQIEQVTAYFTGLGYTIQPQVDPETGATIRWEICWC